MTFCLVLLRRRRVEGLKTKCWSEEPAYTNGKEVDKEVLRSTLIADLERLGISTGGFKLVLRDFSKTRYGTYNSTTKTVTVYVFTQPDCEVPYSYKELFKTVLHEVVHYTQWSNPNYVRRKGLMHDVEFYTLLNALENRAEETIFNGRDAL